MTATAAREATAPPTPTTTRRGWVRRHRAALLIALGLVVATAVALLAGRPAPFSDPLDPENAGPDGARAVARVLADQGVRVQITRDAAAFEDATVDEDTTVVVTSADRLGPSTADRLQAHAAEGEIVLVDPALGSLDLFGLPEGIREADPGRVTGRCPDARFAALEVHVDRATAYPAGLDDCFRVQDGALLTRDRGRDLSVLGAGELLSNDQVTRADNAAVALRLLGQHDRLVWYVPDLEDLVGDDATGIGPLLPDWLGPGLWLAALAVVALALWRGRRLGPLATEPLPVTVTAIESTESRGRLYRKANERAHAAAALRRAARARIAAHLGLPRRATTDLDAFTRDVAAAASLDPARVHDLLGPQAAAPATDKDLTQLANDLAELDREVRHA